MFHIIRISPRIVIVQYARMKRFFILSLGVLGLAFFAEPESKADMIFSFGFLRRLPCYRYHYYGYRGDHRHRPPHHMLDHLRHRIGSVEDRGNACVIPLRGMPGEAPSPAAESPTAESSAPESATPESSAPESPASESPVAESPFPGSHSPSDEHP